MRKTLERYRSLMREVSALGERLAGMCVTGGRQTEERERLSALLAGRLKTAQALRAEADGHIARVEDGLTCRILTLRYIGG